MFPIWIFHRRAMHIFMTPRRFFQMLAIALALPAFECAAQSAPPSTPPEVDCSEIVLPKLDPSLTREEQVALLEQAMLDALNRIDPCELPGGAGGGAGGGGGEGGDGASAGKSTLESQAASDVQGDMAEDAGARTAETAAENGAEAGAESGAETEGETETADTRASDASDPAAPSGGRPDSKLPSDIPASETANDDIIAKQFRRAAEEETDPKARAQLWNEYRRYKGLPVQPAPDDSET